MKRSRGVIFRLMVALGACVSGWAGVEPFATIVRGGNGHYLISKWETEEGLPENSATAMVQTTDGYLWFGTFNGLVRFDGVRFKVFGKGSAGGLPGSAVVNLHLDKKNRLWASTHAGVARLESGVWKTYGRSEGWTGDYVAHLPRRNLGICLSLLQNSFF